MPINYKSTDIYFRYAQCYRLQELLRIDHNKMGKLFKDGKITDKEWTTYQNDYFEPMNNEIIKELLFYRNKIKIDDTINTILGDVTLSP